MQSNNGHSGFLSSNMGDLGDGEGSSEQEDNTAPILGIHTSSNVNNSNGG